MEKPNRNSILITGANGFLGKYVVDAYQRNGSIITTFGSTPVKGLKCIQARLPNVPSFKSHSFDTVVHLAGKAHMIPKTAEEEQAFFDINLKGTQALLNALSNCQQLPKRIIFVSSLAVYGRTEGLKISEKDTCNPNTPYGISKLKAEEEIVRWCESNNVNYYIFRPPLISGEIPPGNLGQLASAIKKGWYVQIKNNKARKSVVLASDIAQLFVRLDNEPNGIYNLSDGYDPSFEEIEQAIEQNLNKKIKIAIPYWLISTLAKIGDGFDKLNLPSPLNSKKLKKITASLTMSDQKARDVLNWAPHSVLKSLKTDTLLNR